MDKTYPISDEQREVVHALEANPLLGGLDPPDRHRLLSYLAQKTYAPGELVISEGEADRSMYFLVSGEARITRGDLDLGVVKRGEHFGELTLVGGRKRAASIVAGADLVVAELSLVAFERLADEYPDLGLRLLRALINGLGHRLTEMTENVDRLLHDRSLPRRTHIDVRIGGEKRIVRTGTTVAELLPAEIDGRRVVAGLVDNRAVSLQQPLSSDCTLAPLTTGHWEGERVYRHSLGLLIFEAAHAVAPELRLRIWQSAGYGQRLGVNGLDDEEIARFAEELSAKMVELVEADQPLHEEWWQVDEARAYFQNHSWIGAERGLDTVREATVRLVSYGVLYAPRMGPLVPSTGRLAGFRVVPEGDSLLVMYRRHGIPIRGPDDQPTPEEESLVERARQAARRADSMTRAHRRWLSTLNIKSVGEFNRACIEGNVSDLIRVAEGFQEKRIGQIADALQERAGEVKVVCIAGPSSSGKTTFIKRLRVQLQVNGINPVGLGLDDYYVDRDLTPRDEKGEFDFEAFDAIRTDLLQEHLARLRTGEPVRTAHFDFAGGKSHPDGGPEIQLRETDVLMLEGIHGLNPKLVRGTPNNQVFRIFVAPLAQLPYDRLNRLHASDVRLLRRIIRDRHTRGLNASENIRRWPSVRRGERIHIFPYAGHADAIVDTSLIYEVSVLKVYAERYLFEVPHDDPAYTTAFRLLNMVNRFVTIYPDHVPPNSILREFVGGSGFE